jgi:serine/threonine protein kinase
MLQIGADFDGHQIMQDLGGGAYGKVYKVSHSSSGIDVALKIAIPTQSSLDLQRFYQENDILHILDSHPRILAPHSTVKTFQLLDYYTMELADWHLEEHLGKNSLSWEQKIEMFTHICEGLKYAHDKGIVHRDLHCQNVLIKLDQDNENIKINDFGKAKDFNSILLSSLGVPCWGGYVIPPEIYYDIWDDPSLDNYIQGDIYALGLLFFEIIDTKPVSQVVEMITLIMYQKAMTQYDKNTLTEVERIEHFDKWVQNIDPSKKSLSVILPDIDLTRKVNQILGKMTSVDYLKRYRKIEEILNDIQNLNI